MKPYYEDESVVIYNADCRDVLPQLNKVDLVLTDPPYGIAYASGRVAETTTAQWMKSEIVGDSDASMRDEVLSMLDAPSLVFGSWKVAPPAKTKTTLVWDKGDAGSGDLSIPWKPSWEMIYVIGDGFSGHRGSGVLKYVMVTRASMGRVHPNEKPVPLLRELLVKSPEGTVLDPFMGSGTTLRAAKDLGRKAIGIEIEERYCEIAAKRMSQLAMQL